MGPRAQRDDWFVSWTRVTTAERAPQVGDMTCVALKLTARARLLAPQHARVRERDDGPHGVRNDGPQSTNLAHTTFSFFFF
jgi:hypothetical protein